MKSLGLFILNFIVGIVLFAIFGALVGGSDGAIWSILIGLFILIYLIPSLVAYARKVPSKFSITVLNVLLGWSLIGWVISLVWACKKYDYVPPDLRKN